MKTYALYASWLFFFAHFLPLTAQQLSLRDNATALQEIEGGLASTEKIIKVLAIPSDPHVRVVTTHQIITLAYDGSYQIRQRTPFDAGVEAAAAAWSPTEGSIWVVGQRDQQVSWSQHFSVAGKAELEPITWVESHTEVAFTQVVFVGNGKGYLLGTKRGGGTTIRVIENGRIGRPSNFSTRPKETLCGAFPFPYSDEATDWYALTSVGHANKTLYLAAYKEDQPTGNSVSFKDVAQFQGMTWLPNEKMYLVGSRDNYGSQTWVATPKKPQGQPLDEAEAANRILASARAKELDECLLLTQVDGARQSKQILALYADEAETMFLLDTLALPSPLSDAQDAHLLYLRSKKWLAVGTVRSAEGPRTLRIAQIQDESIASKGGNSKRAAHQRKMRARSALARGNPASPKGTLTDFTWTRSSQANNLEAPLVAGEQITASFFVANIGDEPLSDAQIDIAVVPSPSSLYIQPQFRGQYVDDLPAGRKKQYFVKMDVDATLDNCPAKLIFSLKTGDKTLETKAFTLNCAKSGPTCIAKFNRNATNQTTEKGLKLEGIIGSRTAVQTDINKMGFKIADERLAPNKAEVAGLELYAPKFADMGQQDFTWTVPLPLEPTLYTIQYEGCRDTITIDPRHQPSLYILAIGVDYTGNSAVNKLQCTRTDAYDFVRFAQQQKGAGFFKAVYVVDTLTTTDRTTRAAINAALQKLRKYPIQPYDYVYLYYSGHGSVQDGIFGWQASNYSENDNDTFLKYADFVGGYLSKIEAQIVVFQDACHSGASIGKGNDNPDALNEAIRTAMNSLPQTIHFNSSSGNSFSYEIPTEQQQVYGKNGLFTAALLEAGTNKKVILQSGEEIWADRNGNGIVTFEELSDFLARRVADIGNQVGHHQVPNSLKSSKQHQPNFPIFALPKK